MPGRIFLLQQNETLTSMTEQPYEAEALLQKLLAEHPDLLAGEQVNPSAPRRWLLVSREVAVPGEQAGGARWSLDHLFIDQDGVPTLVEVKRSSNSQIRREVVGQMLDYAANGSAYWSIEQIVSAFERRCERDDVEPADELAAVLDESLDEDEFWQTVKTNLQAGRVRMLFVADDIPPELRRIIEFLNGQMDPAEVLGVEIKQFVGEDRQVLVPRVVGMTAEAEKKRALGPGPTWDDESFLELLRSQRGPEEARVASEILRWAEERALEVKWGRGRRSGSFSPKLILAGERHNMFTVWSEGGLPVQFQSMRNHPFDSMAMRRQLADRLEEVTDAITIPDDVLDTWPNFRLHMLTDPTATEGFLKAWDWYIEQVKDSQAAEDI